MVRRKKIILELKYKGPSIPYPTFRSSNCILKKKNDGERVFGDLSKKMTYSDASFRKVTLMAVWKMYLRERIQVR